MWPAARCRSFFLSFFSLVSFKEVNLASAGIGVILICGWNGNVQPAYEIPTGGNVIFGSIHEITAGARLLEEKQKKKKIVFGSQSEFLFNSSCVLWSTLHTLLWLFRALWHFWNKRKKVIFPFRTFVIIFSIDSFLAFLPVLMRRVWFWRKSHFVHLQLWGLG